MLFNELGRATKCHLYRIKIFQNRFLKASLFCYSNCPTNVLYSPFGVLKLAGMIEIDMLNFYLDSILKVELNHKRMLADCEQTASGLKTPLAFY